MTVDLSFCHPMNIDNDCYPTFFFGLLFIISDAVLVAIFMVYEEILLTPFFMIFIRCESVCRRKMPIKIFVVEGSFRRRSI